ncbi:MAG: hypothetical protein Q9M40_13035 [Sulfurimonas sp.]|nr:hypothetical protein [Sulfurimonas sp.]
MTKSIIFSLSILFSACSTPHIEHTQDNTLQITMNDKLIIKGEGTPLYKNSINLLHLNIQQKVFLMNNDTVLVYEDAIAGSSYQFRYGIKRIINIIFPQYSNELVDSKDNMHFFILNTKADTEYLILENMNKKRLKIIYGLDKKVFDFLLNRLDKDETLDIDRYLPILSSKPEQLHKKDKQLYIKSDWNMKSPILNNMVRKVGIRKAQR